MIKLTTKLPASSTAVYTAWLDGEKHGAMTGGQATASKKVGEKFTAWDGYISGKNLELVPGKKIVQTWRTTEFSDADPDSILTIELKATKTGTSLKLKHVGTPKNQEASYREGWEEHYFAPMKEYFS
ncbi:MAG: SRPBCC domain-containing protein [Patescibacteria group bacterium]|jgi:activator of HSP90 ATPase